VNKIDPWGLDATNWDNKAGGRSPLFDGPTNGNWGGRCWSGGQYSCGSNPMGNAPPTDSGDLLYREHDLCYDKCGHGPSAKYGQMQCDKKLVNDLKSLPDDSKQWPRPPRSGTESDSEQYRDMAISHFTR
jgi:hypothetical protein